MDPTIDAEEFVSFDECTNVTRTYLHHDGYGPDYVYHVYHHAHRNHMGLDLDTADNTYCFSPNV